MSIAPTAPSIAPRGRRPRTTDAVITITASKALRQSDNYATVVFNSTSTLTATLPPPFKGGSFCFYVKAAATSGLGHSINTAGSAEKTFAKGFTEAAGKGAVNTQATGAKGDSFEVISDGTDWFGFPVTGTWARQA